MVHTLSDQDREALREIAAQIRAVREQILTFGDALMIEEHSGDSFWQALDHLSKAAVVLERA